MQSRPYEINSQRRLVVYTVQHVKLYLQAQVYEDICRADLKAFHVKH